MKRYFLFLIVLLVAIYPLFAHSYKVNVSSTLNLRSEPSPTSDILLKLNSGDIVECPLDLTITRTEWVSVNYKGTEGYLKAQYLTPTEDILKNDQSSTNIKQWYELLDWEGEGYKWMVYLICALILVMWFECKFIRHLGLDFLYTHGDNSSKKWRCFNGLLLLLTSCIILFYVFQMGNNSLWFFNPKIVNSWWFIVLNFMFFVYILINLLVFFLQTIKDIARAAEITINLKFGLYSWLLGTLGLVICGIGSYDPTYLYLLEGICQIIQIGIILIQLSSKGHFLWALFTCLLYVVGSLSLVLLTACLLFVFIIFVIFIIAFIFVFKVSTTPGGVFSDKHGIPDPNGSMDSDGDYTITNPDGIRTTLIHNSGDIYNGSDGYLYRRVGNAFFRL